MSVIKVVRNPTVIFEQMYRPLNDTLGQHNPSYINRDVSHITVMYTHK